MDLLLGLDVGTTATKALLINTNGDLIASASYNYGLITPHEDWVEQDPEELWKGVVNTCQKVMKSVKPTDRLLALSISSQAGTTIPIDAKGKPLRNAFSWMDNRAHKESEQINEALGKDKIYELSGWQLGDGLPLLHILWMRKNEPEIFSSVKYFLFVNDFIVYRLTEQLCMDPSDAGITQLYNVRDGKWDENALKIAGISQNQLSPIMNSGAVISQLTKEASRETGLPESTLVVNGAHDQYCAAVGSGVLKSGDVMLSCGTAWVILCFMEKFILDPDKRLSISRHAIPDKWGAIKSLGGVGACMEWFLKNIWQSDGKSDIYNDLNNNAEKVPVGSRGLIFFPSSGGYGRGSRGAFVGLTLAHTQSDMARAVMEGIVFDLRWTMKDLAGSVEAKELRMVGGAAGSPVWRKIVADITQIPVAIPSVTQAASYGAAILAGVGSRVFLDPETGYRALSGKEIILEPDEENSKKYDKLFLMYQRSFKNIQSSLIDLSEFESGC